MREAKQPNETRIPYFRIAACLLGQSKFVYRRNQHIAQHKRGVTPAPKGFIDKYGCIHQGEREAAVDRLSFEIWHLPAERQFVWKRCRNPGELEKGFQTLFKMSAIAARHRQKAGH